MHDNQQDGADDHDGGPFPFPVVNPAEQGRKQNIPEREQHRYHAGDSLVHVELVYHQVSRVLQEGEYGRVEKDAQERDQPPPLVAQYLPDIGYLELVIRVGRFRHLARFRLVKLLIHHHVDQEEYQADAEANQCHQQGSGDVNHPGSLRDGYRETQGHGGTNTGHRHLHAHGHRQLLPLEPLHDDLRGGDTGHLDPHGKGSEADAGPEEPAVQPEDGHPFERGAGDTPVLDGGSNHHERCGAHAGHAYPQLIEDDAAEDQHQQEDVKPAVGAGVGAVIGPRPAQLALQQTRQGRHHVR